MARTGGAGLAASGSFEQPSTGTRRIRGAAPAFGLCLLLDPVSDAPRGL